MTISAVTDLDLIEQYAGNGATVGFAYGYPVQSDDELVVVLTSALGVDTVKTRVTHYTVSGAPAGGPYLSGVTVTMLIAPAVGETLTIYRETDQDQESNFTASPSFPIEVVGKALDKLTMLHQEAKLEQVLGIRLPKTVAGVSSELAKPVANRVLKWNAGATALINSTTDPDDLASAVSDAEAAQAAAEAAQAAAEAAESNAETAEINADASAVAAAASAASVNLPSITGNALQYLRANAGETALEYATVTDPDIAQLIQDSSTSNATNILAEDLMPVVDISAGAGSKDRKVTIAELAKIIFDNAHKYVSTGQTVTTAGTLTLPHSLGVVPSRVGLLLEFVTAQSGWVIGDKFDLSASISQVTINATNYYGANVWADATNVYIQYGNHATVFLAFQRTGTPGSPFGVTNTNVELIVEAYR